MAAQPFDITATHDAPRAPDGILDEFWLENPFDFQSNAGVNLSRFERNRMMFNVGGARFVDVSAVSTTDIDSDTRAVAIGDLNNDGRPDLIVRNSGGGPLRIFLNRIEQGSSIKVLLKGTTSNAQGIGARLWLTVGERTLYREHFPQNSMAAQNALETIFGLGTHEGPARLEIQWPTGKRQVVENLTAGTHTITEE